VRLTALPRVDVVLTTSVGLVRSAAADGTAEGGGTSSAAEAGVATDAARAIAASSIDTSRLRVRERLAVMGIVWRSSQHVAEAGAVEGGRRWRVTVFIASRSSAMVAWSSIVHCWYEYTLRKEEEVNGGAGKDVLRS
jgi:hypothetical protein